MVLFSGGRDSFLCCCKLIDKYDLVLLHCDNGSELGTDFVETSAERLQKKYGKDHVKYLPVEITAEDFQRFIHYLWTEDSSTLVADGFRDLIYSQGMCLCCRSAMYLHAIKLCQKKQIHFLVDGARQSQLFGLEQPIMIDEYSRLCKKFGVELLTPVYNLTSDDERKCRLMNYGFVPKTLESQYTLGIPMDGPLTGEELDAVHKYYLEKIVSDLEGRAICQKQ